MNPSELEGDLREWGDMMEMDVLGLTALGYPASQPETPSGGGIPVPNYYPRGQINALNRAIGELEDKYKDLLILKYACKLNDRDIHRQGLCHYNSVPKRLEDAKKLLVKTRYWRT